MEKMAPLDKQASPAQGGQGQVKGQGQGQGQVEGQVKYQVDGVAHPPKKSLPLRGRLV